MTLKSPVTDIKGVGPELGKLLAKLSVFTVEDLINFLPRKYKDFSDVVAINQLKPGRVTIQGVIKQAKGRYVRRGMHITEAIASDATGSVRLIWFNQPYRADALKPNTEYFISGDFGLHRQRMTVQNPSVELVSDFPVNTARIIPVYKETKGLRSLQIRWALREVMPLIRTLGESLPTNIVKKHKLIKRGEAYEELHFPSTEKAFALAQRRVGFEEVFRLSLAALLNKYELMHEEALRIPFDKNLAQQFVRHLPFELTNDQRRVVWDIYQDLAKEHPMNRLIEGDVGSGKTVIAAMAAIMAIQQGYQVAYMAPTELLARQHSQTILNLMEPLGLGEKVCLLVGSLKPTEKKQAHERIKAGHVQFIIGTNALIQEKVDMQHLGLVIIDEQHRFGVEQRTKLQAKAGHMPHVLSMTATPIPRSLALTLYGELDISVLANKPASRKPIITKLVSPNSRAQLYKTIEKEIASGRQMFVVCPLIEEDLEGKQRSAQAVYKELQSGPLKHHKIGLLHGKLKAEEKQKAMKKFLDHDLDILVATTVIEVGVDVPNATVMLVEQADRFGLAQIHQLRGRVGRSHYQGYCYLMLSDSQEPSPRLRALESSQDGFRLAELDLELRGPGAIYGTVQHGALDLRVAKLSDTKLIAEAREAAQECIDKQLDLVKYPELYDHVKRLRAVTNLN